MATVGRWCPNCGGGLFERVRLNGVETGDLMCLRCREVGKPAYFERAFPELACKNPACGRRVSRRDWHQVTSFGDFGQKLREGFIRCPACRGRHKAEDGRFGEYDPET